MARLPLAILAFACAVPASAQDGGRDLCPDRPGLGTPACTLDPGRLQLELGIGDWTRNRDAGTRTDTFTAGEMLLRWGLDSRTELQVGWTAWGRVRVRDGVSQPTVGDSGTGDATLAIRRNLRNPDGSGTSIAVMPYVSLPTGGGAIGAGDWGAGLLIPLSFDLDGAFSFALTPSLAAAVDEDGDGRHLAYGSVIGLGVDLGSNLGASFEFSATRDEDPAGHTTDALAGLSLGWQPSDDVQLDVGANLGLNRASDDVGLYIGISRRF